MKEKKKKTQETFYIFSKLKKRKENVYIISCK